MIELEKIAYAKSFIDKLANGINPIDDTPIPEGDIANNVRLSRCFFYVSDILRQVIENGGTVPSNQSAKVRKQDFCLSQDVRARLLVSERAITVSDIANNLNSYIDLETTKKITAASINDWLVSVGLLEIVKLQNGKQRKQPTVQGNEIGLFLEERRGQFEQYYIVLFTPDAQQLIYDNIEAIVAFKQTKKQQRI
ncbi:MAG: hypothetical protein J6S23_07865 [Clostridia bacterium]|nr:hypothetical protein [Clostridia bacterium]